MGSFEEPFRGLPAEIRLTIWEYVALPIINISEVVEATFNEYPDIRDGENRWVDQPHPCSTHNELSLDQAVFKSPLQFLAAVTTVNRVVRAEFLAVIQKHGLSFQVDLPAVCLVYYLTEQLQGPHAPRIKALMVCAPHRPRVMSELDMISNRSARQLHQPSTTDTQIQSSRPLVEQVEININSRSWSAEVVRLTEALSDTSDSTATFSFSHESLVRLAAPDIKHDFDVAEELIFRRLVRQVVFNITNLNNAQKQVIVDRGHAWENQLIFEHCVVTFGPPRPEEIETHGLIEVGTYCYKIEFSSKSEIV